MSTSSELSTVVLEFLKKFNESPMRQRDIVCYCGNEGWQSTLGAPVSDVVAAFKEKNLIRLATATEDTEYLAGCLMNASKIKTLLKREGLQVSEKKKILSFGFWSTIPAP